MKHREIRKFLIPHDAIRDIVEGREKDALEKIRLRIKVLRKKHLSIVRNDDDESS